MLGLAFASLAAIYAIIFGLIIVVKVWYNDENG